MSYSKLIVNLDNIKENVECLKRRQADGCKVIAMVKANAYGLGMVEVSKYLEKEKLVEYFGVAYLSEALKLKEEGIMLPIVITSPGLKSEIEEVVKYDDVIPNVSDYEYVKALNDYCESKGITKKIQIEVNTGMNRFGFGYKEAVNSVDKIHKLKNIQVEGIYTHFASIDIDMDFTNIQKERFDNVLDEIKRRKIDIPLIHASNSAGSVSVSDDRYNAIRPGIMMYGYYPDASFRSKVYLKPSCKLVSTITHILDVEQGNTIGYNNIYTAMKDMRIATVNIGYADGLKKMLLNKGKMLVLGNKCDIVGDICMDICMIDITGIEGIEIGAEAVIFDYTNITVEQIASQCETVNYEILTSIGNRVKREYIENI